MFNFYEYEHQKARPWMKRRVGLVVVSNSRIRGNMNTMGDEEEGLRRAGRWKWEWMDGWMDGLVNNKDFVNSSEYGWGVVITRNLWRGKEKRWERERERERESESVCMCVCVFFDNKDFVIKWGKNKPKVSGWMGVVVATKALVFVLVLLLWLQ